MESEALLGDFIACSASSWAAKKSTGACLGKDRPHHNLTFCQDAVAIYAEKNVDWAQCHDALTELGLLLTTILHF